MAKRLAVTRRGLSESWRGVLGWSAAIVGMLVVYLPLYPSLAGPDLQALIDSLPEALIQTLGYDQIATGAGYTQASFLGLLGFALFAIYAVNAGASAGGGHEESGRLELDLAHRISRTGFVAQTLVTLLIQLAWLATVTWVTIAVLNGPSELDLNLTNLTWAVLSLFALSFAIGTVALAGGIMTGRQRRGVQAGSAIALFGYVANAVASLVEQGQWLKNLSPYAWAFGAEPLTTGADVIGLALLAALAAVGIVASFIGLAKRDILG